MQIWEKDDKRKKISNAQMKIYSLDETFDICKLSYEELNVLANIIISKNRGFNYFVWRKKAGLSNASYTAYRDLQDLQKGKSLSTISMEFILSSIIESRFSEQKEIIDVVVALIKHRKIMFVENGNKSACYCRKTNKYPYSEIYIENLGNGEENVNNIFHEIGHAILNYYMEVKGLQADREYEEYIAHFFEFCVMVDTNMSTAEAWFNRAKRKVNFHLTEAYYLNELFLHGKKYKTWQDKKRLFSKCANTYFYTYPTELENEIVGCPDFFKYPFDSYYSVSGLKKIINEKSEIEIRKNILEVIYENVN